MTAFNKDTTISMFIPIFYRYVIRETVALFLAINLILMAIILSFRLSALLSNAVSGDMHLSAVWKLIGLQSINILTILMPVALILAGIMTLTRLYRDQEISALFAAGIGRSHLHHMILSLAIPVAIVLLILTLYIQPTIYARSSELRDQARQQAGFALLTANSFRRLDDGTVIHTGSASGKTYMNFFVAQDLPANEQTPASRTVVFAQTGLVQQQKNNQILILNQGHRLSWDDSHQPQNATYSQFEQAEIYLPSAENSPSTRSRAIPTSALTNSSEHLAELQKRINPAIAMLIFCLCLPLLAHSKPRKIGRSKLLPAFLIFALYSNTLDLATKAIAKDKLSVWPGSLTIHLIALILIFLWWTKMRKAI